MSHQIKYVHLLARRHLLVVEVALHISPQRGGSCGYEIVLVKTWIKIKLWLTITSGSRIIADITRRSVNREEEHDKEHGSHHYYLMPREKRRRYFCLMSCTNRKRHLILCEWWKINCVCVVAPARCRRRRLTEFASDPKEQIAPVLCRINYIILAGYNMANKKIVDFIWHRLWCGTRCIFWLRIILFRQPYWTLFSMNPLLVRSTC